MNLLLNINSISNSLANWAGLSLILSGPGACDTGRIHVPCVTLRYFQMPILSAFGALSPSVAAMSLCLRHRLIAMLHMYFSYSFKVDFSFAPQSTGFDGGFGCTAFGGVVKGVDLISKTKKNLIGVEVISKAIEF